MSVFSVLLGNKAKSLVFPNVLAKATAKDLFKQYEIDETEEISFKQLKNWFDRSRFFSLINLDNKYNWVL